MCKVWLVRSYDRDEPDPCVFIFASEAAARAYADAWNACSKAHQGDRFRNEVEEIQPFTSPREAGLPWTEEVA